MQMEKHSEYAGCQFFEKRIQSEKKISGYRIVLRFHNEERKQQGVIQRERDLRHLTPPQVTNQIEYT